MTEPPPDQTSPQRHPTAAPAASALLGRNWPLGAAIIEGRVNFSLYSRGATAVELLLFHREDDREPARVIEIDPE